MSCSENVPKGGSKDAVSSERTPAAKYDVGDQEVGAILNHSFLVRNDSRRTLLVSGLSASCSCTTVPEALPKEVPPTGTITVPVALRVQDTAGVFESSVVVKFTDHPPVVLVLAGRAVESVPKRLEFGKFKAGDAPIRRITFGSTLRKINVKTAAFDERALRAVVGDGFDVPRSSVDVTIADGVSRGPIDTTLVLETDDPQEPRKRVSVTGYVLRDMELRNGEVAIAAPAAAGDARGEIRLYSPYALPLRLTAVRSSKPEEVAVRLDAANNIGPAEVSIPVFATAKAGEKLVQATVTVEAEVGGRPHSAHAQVYLLRR